MASLVAVFEEAYQEAKCYFLSLQKIIYNIHFVKAKFYGYFMYIIKLILNMRHRSDRILYIEVYYSCL